MVSFVPRGRRARSERPHAEQRNAGLELAMSPKPAPHGPWRVMFLGQGPLAEFAYGRLLDLAAAAELDVVVTCSNPCGVGTWWGTSRIREAASAHSTLFVPNERRNDQVLEKVSVEQSVNCVISVGHPWLVSERVLGRTDRVAAFNLHNAPLPRYGGFNTGSHAILEGATDFGSTLHWMEPEADAGPIAFMESFPIPDGATARALHFLTLEAGRRLFGQLVDCLVRDRLPPRVPMNARPTIYPRAALSEHREIFDMANDVEVDRKSRAFWFPPFEPAFSRTLGRKYYVVPSEGLSHMGRSD